MKDFYYILGIGADCTPGDIKEAYRKLSKKFHPDLNQNDKYFENRFKEIQEAYETLSDPVRRSRYDNELKRSKFQQNTQQQSTNRPTGGYYKTRPATNNRPKTRALDIGFTIILFIITLIFADYVLRSVSSSKKIKVNKAPAVEAVFYTPPKRHKKKHTFKVKTASVSHKVNIDSTNIRPVQPPPVPIKKTVAKENFLYATTIRSNITEVTNMRQSDDYTSAIIKVIPTNSKVLVIEKGDTFYKVLFNNVSGYVPKWTLLAK